MESICHLQPTESEIEMNTKIISTSGSIKFDNGYELDSYHSQDCCESHYLDFSYVIQDEVKDLEFDLSNDNFFKKVDGYGIELIPINGFSVKIPGYGSNNGYYSTDLRLILTGPDGVRKQYDVTECQTISD